MPTDDPSMNKVVAVRHRKGFQAGEKVIVQGQQRVRPGMVVTPSVAPSTTPAQKQ